MKQVAGIAIAAAALGLLVLTRPKKNAKDTKAEQFKLNFGDLTRSEGGEEQSQVCNTIACDALLLGILAVRIA